MDNSGHYAAADKNSRGVFRRKIGGSDTSNVGKILAGTKYLIEEQSSG